jgi:hypothetical protein
MKESKGCGGIYCLPIKTSLSVPTVIRARLSPKTRYLSTNHILSPIKSTRQLPKIA